MPIFMDIHLVPGLEAIHAAEAHRKDMLIQEHFQCKAMTYWIDEPRGSVFCLIEAPDRESVEEMHRQAHGLVPNKIIEVNDGLVESFLGRINDPKDAVTLDNGLKIFSDSAFRILLVTDHMDPILLHHRMGKEQSTRLFDQLHHASRRSIVANEGRKVEHAGNGILASFTSAAKAIQCARSMLGELPTKVRSDLGLKMAINAGEPVADSDKIFGDVIQLARHLCTILSNEKVIIASKVRDLLGHDYLKLDQKEFMTILPQQEGFMESLFKILDKNWQDPDFDLQGLCKNMSMSKSHLYRKTISFWGMSPNNLIREYRLDKSRDLLKKQSLNIAQATFDSGFNSPSYFTKCFKKKFGLLPANYLNAAV